MKNEIYIRINNIIGGLTPLRGHDCGQLCECACCRGDTGSGFGMRLFPGERSPLNTVENENGRFVVCGGKCDRSHRPLACRIFPFYPAIDDVGEITAIIDGRGARLCPLVRCCDDVIFDDRFIEAVEEAGRLLSADEECAEEMRRTTEEIVIVNRLVFGDEEDDPGE